MNMYRKLIGDTIQKIDSLKKAISSTETISAEVIELMNCLTNSKVILNDIREKSIGKENTTG